MAEQKKMVEAITSMEVDFAQWYTDVVKKAELIDYTSVKAIADKYGLFVVEDCAQSHNALYEGKQVGSLGEMGCFSFYPGKNLYAFGEGGSITMDNKEYFDHITRLKNQGSDVRYYHEEIGYNMYYKVLKNNKNIQIQKKLTFFRF